jgi:hypothetical protein
MSTQPTFGRLLGASALGLASLAACAGAASPARDGQAEAVAPGSPDAVEEARRIEADREKDRGDAGPSANGDVKGTPRCPYGELSDPHRGFIRCLTPDERNGGELPPPNQEPPAAPAPPDTGKAATPPPPPGPPPLVDVGTPKFENGDVPKVEKSLSGLVTDIAKCVAEHGGLSGATGSLKVQFLVRARGRAEGVEVLSAKGIGAEAASCVRVLLKNRSVGAPSADPVGVTVTLTLKAPPK